MRVQVETEWHTPAGRPRNVPMFSATVRNAYLGTSKTFRGSDSRSVSSRATTQLERWQEQERKKRDAEAKQDALEQADAEAEALDLTAKGDIEAVSSLLKATLAVDDRIDWEELRDRREPGPFVFDEPQPRPVTAVPQVFEATPDPHPPQPWYASFWPGAEQKWRARCAEVDAANQKKHARADRANRKERRRCKEANAANAETVREWQDRHAGAKQRYEAECQALAEQQREHNSRVDAFKQAFEAAVPGAVLEYMRGVFERSDYPECFPVEHTVEFEGKARLVRVVAKVPALSEFPDVTGYKFARAKREAKPTKLKKREHQDLYERAVAECIIRTLHEVFEADYAAVISEVEVSAVVSFVDPATGNDKHEYKAVASCTRDQFLAFDLTRIDPVICLQRLSHATMASG